MNEVAIENPYQGLLELAKHSTIRFSLSGWPAAVALMSLPTAVVLIYAMKVYSTRM